MSDVIDFNGVSAYDNGPIPAGKYHVSIKETEYKVSAAGAEYLSVRFSVRSGEHKGRIVFNNYNLFHANEKVRGIALSQLKTLMANAGLDVAKLSTINKYDLLDMLAGSEVGIRVGIRINDQYGDQNEVKGYYKLSPAEMSSDEGLF